MTPSSPASSTRRDTKTPSQSSEPTRTPPEPIAMSISIWRNEVDPKTGGLKIYPTPYNTRGTIGKSITLCIYIHKITKSSLFDSYLYVYLKKLRDADLQTGRITEGAILASMSGIQTQPPIPRSIAATPSNLPYFTIYLDDLTYPGNIPVDKRNKVWMNIPIEVWVWGLFRSFGVGLENRNKGRNAQDPKHAVWLTHSTEDWDKWENLQAEFPATTIAYENRVLGEVLAKGQNMHKHVLEEMDPDVAGNILVVSSVRHHQNVVCEQPKASL